MKILTKLSLLFLFFLQFNLGFSQPGTSCVDPWVINSLPYDSLNFKTCNFGNNYGTADVPCTSPNNIANFIQGNEVVFAYTPSVDEEVLMTYWVNNWDAGIFVFDNCPFTAANCIYTAKDPDTDENIAVCGLSLLAGQTYYFVFSYDDDNGWYSCGEFKFRFWLDLIDPNAVPTTQDCLGAIPVCQDIYSESNSYVGSGNIACEINNSTTCIDWGDLNYVWYTFTAQTSGQISFDITPNNSSDDYDWALYDLSNYTCEELYSEPTSDLRCNFDGLNTTSNPNSLTGMCSGCNSNNGYQNSINVTAGQTFALMVNNFSSSQNGYTIDFGPSTAQIFDDIPPEFDSVVSPIPCGATELTFIMSENIQCSSVDASDIILSGPGGPYTVTSISSVICDAGGEYDNTFTITVTPPLSASGSFNLSMAPTGSFTDICGNVANNATFDFVIDNIQLTTSVTDITDCANLCSGSISVTNPTGGTAPYTYSWSHDPGLTSSSATGLCENTYTVTVTDAGGCQAVFTTPIVNTSNCGPTITLSASPTTICEGNSTTLTQTTTNGLPGYTYVWDNSLSATGPHTVSPTSTTTYNVTVTDANGDSQSASVTVAVNPIYNSTENVNVCENDSYTYPDGTSTTITGSTSYTSNLTTDFGCDSIIVTTVVMDPIYNSTEAVDVCQNQAHTYPDGTTAIINGSTSYTSTLSSNAGCDSIIVTNVTMTPNVTNSITVGVCSGTNYTYADGTTSTNILVTENHVSTLVSGAGCDSVLTETLSIVTSVSNTVNTDICSGASYTFADGATSNNITSNISIVTTLVTGGGCDSVITENVNVLAPNTVSTNLTICTGASITVGSSTYNATGIYTDILVDANGCDSTITTNLTVLAPNVVTTNPVICSGQSYAVGSSTYNATGTYTDVLTDANGCDSTITTSLTVEPIYNLTEAVSVCLNQSHTYPDGSSATINGNTSYTSTLSSGAGCDSIIVTTVTMIPNATNAITVGVCSGTNYTYADGTTSTNILVTENHVSTLVSGTGCDSVLTETLTIVNTVTNTVNVDICSGTDYTYADGTTSFGITSDETNVTTLVTGGGCDSVITENVNVLAPNTVSTNPTICNGASITVGSSTYNATGVYTDVLVDANGCDSTITTNLTALAPNVVTTNPVICTGQSYSVGSSSYNATGTFTDVLTDVNGCDSTITTNLTVSTADDAAFNYPGAIICISATDPSPTITGLTGGNFSIDNGGMINTSTGVINLTGSGAGNYTVTYSTNGPCPNSATSAVVITSLDDASFTYSNAIYCIDAANPTPTITGVTGGVFTIDNGGTIDATTGEINIAASGTGTYNITYTTVGACANSTTETIAIKPLDNAGFTFSTANYCIAGTNPTPTLSGAVSGIFSMDNGGVINSSTGEIDLSASGAGTYIIDFITTGACPNSSSVSIAIEPLDDASFSYGATQYCNNDPFPLPSITGVVGGIFTISNGGVINASTGEIDVNTSGLGSFTITYNTNSICAGTATFDITIINCSPPIADFTVSDSTICAGDCIDLTDQSQLGVSLQWVMIGGTPDSSTSSNPTVCYPNPGTYSVVLTVTNPFGTDSKTITIKVNTTPIIDAGMDVTIPLGAVTILNATGASSYTWSPSHYLDCFSCASPTASVTSNTTFTVMAMDENGCIGYDTVKIIIDGEIEIFIPNIFSPNGDGENDIFKVYGSSFPDTYRMQIYNRWGSLIFESNDQNVNWDGKDKNSELMPQAVFIYKFWGVSIVGLTFEKTGNVMLTR